MNAERREAVAEKIAKLIVGEIANLDVHRRKGHIASLLEQELDKYADAVCAELKGLIRRKWITESTGWVGAGREHRKIGMKYGLLDLKGLVFSGWHSSADKAIDAAMTGDE